MQAGNPCKHIVGTISTNARITQHIDDMRQAVHQAPRQSYVAWCEWRRPEETDVQMQAAESQSPNDAGTRLGAKKRPTTWCRRKLECNSLRYPKGCSPEGGDWPQQYLEGSCALNQRKEELIFLGLPNIAMLSETLHEKKWEETSIWSKPT